ncbi:MAG: D-2-hydroxyacid dehydrogenase [Anaerolineales bacterium]|nr:D-2-hydroxyacid dehydrogenase [Anaerolineales bacterium]
MDTTTLLITIPLGKKQLDKIRAVSPGIHIEHFPVNDAAAIPETVLEQTDILFTGRTLPDPESLPSLKWIQFHYAGIDYATGHPLLQKQITICTASGAATPQMAEFALMAMLALGHRLPHALVDQRQKSWTEHRFERFRPQELRFSTVGMIGYGSVARDIARLLKPLGTQILAVKRDLTKLEESGFSIEGTGDPHADFPTRIYPPEAVGSMASLCDFLVITAPLTTKTRGMIDEHVFNKMKPTSYLIDISRGGILDHGALIEALNEGKIAGAFLDVFPVEPLPLNSPLWTHEKVLLTPHIAWFSDSYIEQSVTILIENLHRHFEDRPLLNIYEPNQEY